MVIDRWLLVRAYGQVKDLPRISVAEPVTTYLALETSIGLKIEFMQRVRDILESIRYCAEPLASC